MNLDALKQNLKIESNSLLGMPLHRVNVNQLHAFISGVIEKKAKARILNLNIRGANFGIKLPSFKEAIQTSELVFCDGDGIRWGSQLLGQEAPEKITYDRWIWQLAEYCAEKGHSLFLLGSEPEVAEDAAFKIKQKTPNVKIVGTHHGFFEKEGPETEQVIQEINQVKPDILLVGFGMPVQEKWIQAYWQKIDAHIFLAGGAALECLSGKLTKPPAWMVKYQLEWLYRWMQQPMRRFERYAIGIPYFFFHIFKEKMSRKNA